MIEILIFIKKSNLNEATFVFTLYVLVFYNIIGLLDAK